MTSFQTNHKIELFLLNEEKYGWCVVVKMGISSALFVFKMELWWWLLCWWTEFDFSFLMGKWLLFLLWHWSCVIVSVLSRMYSEQWQLLTFTKKDLKQGFSINLKKKCICTYYYNIKPFSPCFCCFQFFPFFLVIFQRSVMLLFVSWPN